MFFDNMIKKEWYLMNVNWVATGCSKPFGGKVTLSMVEILGWSGQFGKFLLVFSIILTWFATLRSENLNFCDITVFNWTLYQYVKMSN